jgi:hypothetical protein
MKTHTIYNVATGEIAGTIQTTNSEALALNTPEGHASIEGLFDGSRFSIQNGKAVAKTLPSVDPKTVARNQIARLESSQARAIREHLLGNPKGLVYLQQIDAQIEQLRKTLT